eukprot:PhF_6_TR7305/c2_g1_i3/m.10941
MFSLFSTSLTSSSSITKPSSSPFLPRDCVYHIMEFTDVKTTLFMYLVCRSWYHAVDRLLMLADTFYYFPERFVSDILRHRKIPPCPSNSLSSLHNDARWGHTNVMVLVVKDSFQGADCFPPKLTSLQ